MSILKPTIESWEKYGNVSFVELPNDLSRVGIGELMFYIRKAFREEAKEVFSNLGLDELSFHVLDTAFKGFMDALYVRGAKIKGAHVSKPTVGDVLVTFNISVYFQNGAVAKLEFEIGRHEL